MKQRRDRMYEMMISGMNRDDICRELKFEIQTYYREKKLILKENKDDIKNKITNQKSSKPIYNANSKLK